MQICFQRIVILPAYVNFADVYEGHFLLVFCGCLITEKYHLKEELVIELCNCFVIKLYSLSLHYHIRVVILLELSLANYIEKC